MLRSIMSLKTPKNNCFEKAAPQINHVFFNCENEIFDYQNESSDTSNEKTSIKQMVFFSETYL